MKETTRVEREAAVTSWQGNSHQVCYPSYPDLYHELLQTSQRADQGTGNPYSKILVGI